MVQDFTRSFQGVKQVYIRIPYVYYRDSVLETFLYNQTNDFLDDIIYTLYKIILETIVTIHAKLVSGISILNFLLF